MQDAGDREEDSLGRGDEVEQIALNFHRIDLPCETEAACEARHVGVDDDSRGDSEAGAKHDVGGLSSNPRQGGQFLDRTWHPSAVPREQRPATRLNRAGLGAKESGRANRSLQVHGVGLGERDHVRIAPKQVWCDLVDPGIRALSRQDRRDQELERVPVIELDLGIRPDGAESAHDRCRAGLLRLLRPVSHSGKRVEP